MAETPLIFLYADESCLGNQNKGSARPGGAAGLLEFRHPTRGWIRRDFWLSSPDTTNNQMAIQSAILPLRELKGPGRVVFTSDSRYLCDGISSWVHGWVAKNWVKADKKPVENQELWRELIPVVARHQVMMRWVKGHNGHPQNEYANDLAIRAATEQTASGGLVESGFEAWLRAQQARGKCRVYSPEPPADFQFRAGRAMPSLRPATAR